MEASEKWAWFAGIITHRTFKKHLDNILHGATSVCT